MRDERRDAGGFNGGRESPASTLIRPLVRFDGPGRWAARGLAGADITMPFGVTVR